MTRSEFLEQASKQYNFGKFNLKKEDKLREIRAWSKLDFAPEFITDFLFGGGINGDLWFYRFENISDDRLTVDLSYNRYDPISYWEDIGQFAASVARIRNCVEIIEEFYLSEDGRFFDKNHKLKFQAEDELFDYLFTKEYDYHPVITEKTYEMLQHYGWYEGRRVDISPLVEYLQKQGITLSQIQRDAISEFSGLAFFPHNTSVQEFYHVEDMVMSESEVVPEVYDFYSKRLVGKNLLHIGSNYEQFFYLSDDGKIFVDKVDIKGRTILEYINWFSKDLPENVRWQCFENNKLKTYTQYDY